MAAPLLVSRGRPGSIGTVTVPAMNAPVILEVAVNGATSRTRNPHVPITPDEIAADCLACLDAGAAIVHHHDDPRAFAEPGPRGMAALSRATFATIQASRPDALMYPTANFGSTDIRARWDHHRILDEAGLLRLALVDPGSVNLGGNTPDGTPTGSFIYAQSFDDIRYALERGGHLRVGLEDYSGQDTPTNVELVERAAAVCADVGRPLATSAEAATILGLTP